MERLKTKRIDNILPKSSKREVILVVLLTNLRLFNRRRLYINVKIAPIKSKINISIEECFLRLANRINSFEKYPDVKGSATKAIIGIATPIVLPQEAL